MAKRQAWAQHWGAYAESFQPPHTHTHQQHAYPTSWLPVLQSHKKAMGPHLSLCSVLHTGQTAAASSHHNLETTAKKHILRICCNKQEKKNTTTFYRQTAVLYFNSLCFYISSISCNLCMIYVPELVEKEVCPFCNKVKSKDWIADGCIVVFMLETGVCILSQTNLLKLTLKKHCDWT